MSDKKNLSRSIFESLSESVDDSVSRTDLAELAQMQAEQQLSYGKSVQDLQDDLKAGKLLDFE